MRTLSVLMLTLSWGCPAPQRTYLIDGEDFGLQYAASGEPCAQGTLDRPALMTIEAWVQIPEDHQRSLLPLWVWEREFAVFLTPDNILYVNNGEAIPGGLAVPVTIADGRWHHVAVTWDTFDAQVFVDGERVGAGGLSHEGGNTTALSVGCWPGVDSMTGLLDELRITNGLLYSDAFTPTAPLDLLADSILWRMDEGLGPNASDETLVHVLELSDIYWVALDGPADQGLPDPSGDSGS